MTNDDQPRGLGAVYIIPKWANVEINGDGFIITPEVVDLAFKVGWIEDTWHEFGMSDDEEAKAEDLKELLNALFMILRKPTDNLLPPPSAKYTAEYLRLGMPGHPTALVAISDCLRLAEERQLSAQETELPRRSEVI